MLMLTHINKDNTYSVKDTVANKTKHFTAEQLNNYTKPILGIFRNPKSLKVVEVHQVQPDELSEPLVEAINLIKSPQIKDFANCMRRLVPEYFFEEAASSTGKYHPASNLGKGGLLRHTIFVCSIFNHITEIESTNQLLQLTQEEKDLMLVACMFHDFLKEDWVYNISSYPQHPILAANAVRGMAGFLPQPMLEFIAHCIESHMGQWQEPKPSDKYQWLVHLSDYLASRQDITFIYHDTVYKKSNQNLEEIYSNPKDKLSKAEREAIDLFLIKIKGNPAVLTPTLLAKYEINHSTDEIVNIYENIQKYGSCSARQRKYVDMAMSR